MSIKRVTYQGRHTNGVIIPHDGTEYVCGHGETIDLPADLAEKLAEEQPGAFVLATTPTKKKAAQSAVSEED